MLVVSVVKKKKTWLSNNTFYLQMCLAIAQKKDSYTLLILMIQVTIIPIYNIHNSYKAKSVITVIKQS